MVFLGQASNYSWRRAWHHLWAHGNESDSQKLREALAQRYQVQADHVALYHTGRSALTAAIAAVAPRGSTVIIPGLTCIAVVRAVRAAGCRPWFVDIDPGTLQYDWGALEKTLQEARAATESADGAKRTSIKGIDKNDDLCYNVSTVVAQNTLGLPLKMTKLEQIAQKYQLKIVEDLAHSAGRFYPDGREVGTVGAAVALSFGKGKAIDTIEGGALVLRKADNEMPPAPQQLPRWAARWRDRWYPILGNLMRAAHHVGLSKVLTGLCLKFHWIERSADAELNLDLRLTDWQAKLAAEQLPNLPKTPLRQYLLVRDRAELLAKFRAHGYYLDEIWYDTPVSPARYAEEADFPADRCPQTVRVAEQIINFPTWYPPEQLVEAHHLAQDYQIGGMNYD